jgi:CheY-specific phosphatase CheX
LLSALLGLSGAVSGVLVMSLIAGSAKKRMPQGQITITVPTLLRTEDVVDANGLPILALPFDCPTGRFILEIAMRDVPQRAAA